MRDIMTTVPLLQDYDEIVTYIESEIRLAREGIEGKSFSDKNYTGLWDTGSTKSCISLDVVEELGLEPFGKSIIATANGDVSVYTYTIGIELPNGAVISDLLVSASNLSGNEDVLIGMDVIQRGDFHIDNSSGRTNFSFEIRPS